MTTRHPFVDEHVTTVGASPDAVWQALTATVEAAYTSGRAVRYARLVGCDPATASGPRPLAEGSTLPGFRVLTAEPPGALVLEGRHRFSAYTLAFRIDELTPNRCHVRAESRALFPGPSGTLYRRLVIGTSTHSYLMRRMLATIRSRAE
ncbi:hypothetical protein ACIQAC_39405 [Streptomyces sp. NPDC088387]|uniref:hypothetical protein n=1 Tax=Streptomyces sp. NPDC088387 TaxID=3365859 RepID=UPI0038238D27